MSNTMDKETKSNLEKEIVTQLLDPIQSKYTDLIKKKQEEERMTLEKMAEEGEKNTDLPESPLDTPILPPNVPIDEQIDTDNETETDNGTVDDTQTVDDTWTETGTEIGTEGKTESEMGTEDGQEDDDEEDIWRDTEGEAATKIQQAWRKKQKEEPIVKKDEDNELKDTPDELDKSVDLSEKKKPDLTKAAAALQQLIGKTTKADIDKLNSQIQQNENTESLMSILPLLVQKQKLQQEISDKEQETKTMEKETKKEQKKVDTDVKKLNSQISEKEHIQSLLSILPLLVQKQKLENEISDEEKKIRKIEQKTKTEQTKFGTDIKSIDSQISEKANIQSLLSILPLLAQKQKLEEAIQAETKQIEAHMKEEESRHRQLEKDIVQIEKDEEQQKILQKLIAILPLLVKQQTLHNEVHPQKGLADLGKDLKNMFSNARGMIPSMPKMPNMCDMDVTGSASKALSGLSTYLSNTYQDWFEPYNEELLSHRPPEKLGELDKEQREDFKYIGKFTMDMEIGDQPFKQVAHLYYNFKDNMFHTEMELDDILAVDKEIEKQMGIDPSKYPHGAVAIIGENPEILARAIEKDDSTYQQKLQQIKQSLEQGMISSMPMAYAQPVSNSQKGITAVDDN